MAFDGLKIMYSWDKCNDEKRALVEYVLNILYTLDLLQLQLEGEERYRLQIFYKDNRSG